MWEILEYQNLNSVESENNDSSEKVHEINAGIKNKIDERRKRVWNLLIQGFTQQQIADKLGVSFKTISRDYHQLKMDSIEWMESLPKGQIQLYHKTKFETVERVSHELWELYEKTEDQKLKLKILSTIAEKSKLYIDMIRPIQLFKIREMIHDELRSSSLIDSLGGRSKINTDDLRKEDIS